MLNAFFAKDDLVQSATRFPKPANQVPDNITVISSEDIEAIGAHTVAEVLRYVPGLFVSTSQDFGATSLLSSQGSLPRHVLVLLDGVRWNLLSEGNAVTNMIPVGIIERIEIIKGPASSVWGSAMGGVINIITKATGTEDVPSGEVQFSYGEADSLDARAQLFGKTGPLGYYLFTGLQDSQGLEKNRTYNNPQLFSKFDLQAWENTALTLGIGYGETDQDLGDLPSFNLSSALRTRAFHINSTLSAPLGSILTLEATGYHLSQSIALISNVLETGALYSGDTLDDHKTGGSLQFVWQPPGHTIVMGTDFLHGSVDQKTHSGPLLQSFGTSELAKMSMAVDEWGLYVNDSIPLGDLTLTPGLRLDYNTVSGSFVSPSLGATYRLREGTLLRGTVSRSFQYPPLSYTAGGGLFLDPNPELGPESVWAYQLGIESSAPPWGKVRATVFHYHLADLLDTVPYGGGPPAYNDIVVNGDNMERKGVEIEFTAPPVCNVTFSMGGSYIYHPAISSASKKQKNFNLQFVYDGKNSVTAVLAGNYSYVDTSPEYDASCDGFIWRFSLNKILHEGTHGTMKFFFTAHNLFNGEQYYYTDYRNPDRWAETGIRWAF